MFIQSYTQVEGAQSQDVAHAIDEVMKAALGDRPSANGRQSTGPRLCARMLQEYEAARGELLRQPDVTENCVELFSDAHDVGMDVKSPCGLTLCHAVQGSMVKLTLESEDLHYKQEWLAAPMETLDHERLVAASRAFLDHAGQWQQQLAAAYKADSKGSKLRNMAMNNIDLYLARYFEGSGITYYFDKKHADGRQARLLVRLNGRKTLDLPIPHDAFIERLDVVKPQMVRFALMARDGHFTVRNEARSRWMKGGQLAEVSKADESPRVGGLRGWWQRLTSMPARDRDDDDEPQLDTPLSHQVDQYMADKPWCYHLTQNEERCELHVRLCSGMSMIIDLAGALDVEQRLTHDLAYISELVKLRRQFPYRLTGPRKVEWITAKRDEANG